MKTQSHFGSYDGIAKETKHCGSKDLALKTEVAAGTGCQE